MKNDYIERIIDAIQGGEEVGRAKRDLAYAYKQPAYQMYGMIRLDYSIHTDEVAVAIAQQLSLAGINELYITCQASNQLDHWFAMDAFGLKMRGITLIESAEYHQEMERWGSSDWPERLPAIHFSFNEEDQK